MACVKLIFIKYKGRAEYIRFLLAQSSVKYEDVRMEPSDWAKSRKGEDFTKPILEYDGTTISGNIAITKFITSNHGLVGSCEEDNHALFEIVEITEDTWDKMSSMFWEKNPEKKEAAQKELIGVHLPKTLKELEIRAAKNGSGWLVGSEVTCADLAVAVLLEILCDQKPDLLTVFPNLSNLKTDVMELPNIKEWISNRPMSDY